MKIQIRNRFTDEIIIEGDYKDLREAAEQNKADLFEANLFRADLSEADLSEANLFRADLSEANLSEANLFRADLFEAKIKITQKDEIIKALGIEVID